jgi:hypothetical protein
VTRHKKISIKRKNCHEVNQKTKKKQKKVQPIQKQKSPKPKSPTDQKTQNEKDPRGNQKNRIIKTPPPQAKKYEN